ncbi:hypothetical protein PIROE2DRAFT_61621 [Piromyces sp. E2]|nr:hypothetical protein PIROE2DRAFT_61621 [Piromyces sp. E2]|eukprot:OUM62833.1 hypothetical protein PIROE2DRAFT_61621 [Piromyces sp. E2]
MELRLDSNVFIQNMATNGGALYLSNKQNYGKSEERPLNILNNSFKFNKAENFGGAIYSEFDQLHLAVTSNNNITYNKAGIIGAGLFTPSLVQRNLFNVKNDNIANNTVNSYINNYSTKPSYIMLNTTSKEGTFNITSGDYLPLKYLLYDEYNSVVEDITKYYSEIFLRIELKYDEESTRIHLFGNTCSFNNGRCEFNKLRIFANPGVYFFSISIENYNEEIKFNYNEIIVNINSCNENQIKLYGKDDILYCENAKCNEKCPVDNKATCKPTSKDVTKNDPELNKCECNIGWEGNYCTKKSYINFK